jgi:2-dehydropantoate 2-reductase
VTAKICVYGAGAIGGHLAGRLAKGGADVSVIARGPHLKAIQADGLRIQAPDGHFTAAVRATDDPSQIGPMDVVLVTVKSPALPSVAAAIAPLLGSETAVVFVMNGIPWWYFDQHGGPLEGTRLPGLDPDDAVRRAIGPQRAIGGVVYSACTVIAPGIIHVEHARNRLVLGEIDGRISERAQAIAAPLIAGGCAADVTADIRSAVWSKLLLNLATGPIAVLTGTASDLTLTEPALEDAMRAIFREGEAVARALGLTPVTDPDATIRNLRKSAHKSSILQDLELRRPMEVATLYDAPLHLARLAGVATPTLDLLVALTRLRAKTAGLFAD